MTIIQIWKMRSTIAVIGVAAGLSGFTASATAQPEGAINSDELEQAINDVHEAYDAAREALERLPSDRFTTDPALDASEFDAAAIATWVEQNTRRVPYRGVLRGVDGVLLDRKGNSLDRSLLLARLLEDAGYDARLVRGRLSAAATAALLSRAAAHAEDTRPIEPFFQDEIVGAAERAPGEAAVLLRLVGPLQDDVSPEVEEAVADHWWVEAKLNSSWIEVDPLLTGSLAAFRPDPQERFSPDALPDSLFHEVTIRVAIERWDAGNTVEDVPLEHTLRAAEAIYHDFELLFVPYHFKPAPEGSSAELESVAIADTAEEWLPVLRRGSDDIQQQGFNRQGHLERSPGRAAVVRGTEPATAALQGVGRAGVQCGEPSTASTSPASARLRRRARRTDRHLAWAIWRFHSCSRKRIFRGGSYLSDTDNDAFIRRTRCSTPESVSCLAPINKLQSFLRRFTLNPGHRGSPQMLQCASHVSGIICKLSVAKNTRCIPVTWYTRYSGHMANTLSGAKGSGPWVGGMSAERGAVHRLFQPVRENGA